MNTSRMKQLWQKCANARKILSLFSASSSNLQSQAQIISGKPTEIHICAKGKKCLRKGSQENLLVLKQCVKEMGAESLVVIHEEECMSMCSCGPNILVKPDFVRYERVCPEDCKGIIEKHVFGKEVDSPKAHVGKK